MGLTEDETIEMLCNGSVDSAWTSEEIEEFMAISSGDAWVVICPG